MVWSVLGLLIPPILVDTDGPVIETIQANLALVVAWLVAYPVLLLIYWNSITSTEYKKYQSVCLLYLEKTRIEALSLVDDWVLVSEHPSYPPDATFRCAHCGEELVAPREWQVTKWSTGRDKKAVEWQLPISCSSRLLYSRNSQNRRCADQLDAVTTREKPEVAHVVNSQLVEMLGVTETDFERVRALILGEDIPTDTYKYPERLEDGYQQPGALRHHHSEDRESHSRH